jgi:hypothetical protein
MTYRPPMQKPLPMRGDFKDWARKIINRHRSGERIRQISLSFAMEALGITDPLMDPKVNA